MLNRKNTKYSIGFYGLLSGCVLSSILSIGCMAPIRAVGGLAQSVASTTATGVKAGGIMLKDATKATVETAGNAWRKAGANSPDIEPPSLEP